MTLGPIREEVPAFDECNRVYRFADGREMTCEEYLAWRSRLRAEAEDRRMKANCEYQIKCIEATALMDDMMKGYAPNIAYSRAYRRHRGELHE